MKVVIDAVDKIHGDVASGLVNNTPIAPMGGNGSCETVLFQAWVDF
ncbi:hypothetical protein [Holospora elegans]|nr:hypothetical protein [Holospora elegans]